MKKIIVLSIILGLHFTSVNAATLTDAQIVSRIENIQGSVPSGIPNAPAGMDQKGFVGEMLANLFDGNNKIKGFFIQTFQSIWNTQVNTLPRWNGQSFIAGTIRDNGTNIGIGIDLPTERLDVNGNILSRGQPIINNTSPTIYLQDNDDRSAMIHTNNNLLYFLRGSGNNSRQWNSVNDRWPLMLNLENNNAIFGGAGDFLGKIYMRNQTSASDTVDTVATKGYVDNRISLPPNCSGTNQALGWNGTSWTCNVISGGVSNLDLINGLHSSSQCLNLGGEVISNGGNKFCRFNVATCPSGWTQYESWSTTNPGGTSCTNMCWGTCRLNRHAWSNTVTSSCSEPRTTNCENPGSCRAIPSQIGCY